MTPSFTVSVTRKTTSSASKIVLFGDSGMQALVLDILTLRVLGRKIFLYPSWFF